MPRLTASAPKYRKHKPSGQAVVTLASKDYLGPRNSKASKVEYDRLVGEWLAAGRPAAPVEQPHQITVSEIAVAFWRHAKKHYRKHGRLTGTAANYKPTLTLLKQRYGHTLASEFGPLALKALQNLMVELGHSRGYINENIHRIRKIFRWAASEQLIPPSVTEALATVMDCKRATPKLEMRSR